MQGCGRPARQPSPRWISISNLIMNSVLSQPENLCTVLLANNLGNICQEQKRMTLFVLSAHTYQLFREQTWSSCSQLEHSCTSWGQLALLISQNSLWRWMSHQSQEAEKMLISYPRDVCFFTATCTISALGIADLSLWSKRKFRLKENLLFLFANISEKWWLYTA